METAEAPGLDPVLLSTAVARVLAGIGKLDEAVCATEHNGSADDANDNAPEVSHQASPSC